jgi:hypothetical protein
MLPSNGGYEMIALLSILSTGCLSGRTSLTAASWALRARLVPGVSIVVFSI